VVSLNPLKIKAGNPSLDLIITDVKTKFALYGISSKFFISGGCVAGTLNEKVYDDIDIYFYNKVDAENAIEAIKKALSIRESEEKTYYKDVCELDAALVSSVESYNESKYAFTFHADGKRYQLISSFCNDPIILMGSYDLTCCMVSYTSEGNLIKHPEYDSRAILRLSNLSFSSVHRYIKYILVKNYNLDSENFKSFIDHLVDNHHKEFSTLPGYDGANKQHGIDLIAHLVNQSSDFNCRSNFNLLDYLHDSLTKLNSNQRLFCFGHIFLSYINGHKETFYCDELDLLLLDYKMNTPKLRKYTITHSKYIPTDKDKKIIMKFPEYFL
jgi:hypothetical protein